MLLLTVIIPYVRILRANIHEIDDIAVSSLSRDFDEVYSTTQRIKEHQRSNIGFFVNTEVATVEADITCSGEICNLNRLILNIYATPYIGTPWGAPFARNEYWIEYDDNKITTGTLDTGILEFDCPVQWESINVDLQNVLTIIEQEIDIPENDELILLISWNCQLQRWSVSINMNKSPNHFFIDQNTGTITVVY